MRQSIVGELRGRPADEKPQDEGDAPQVVRHEEGVQEELNVFHHYEVIGWFARCALPRHARAQ